MEIKPGSINSSLKLSSCTCTKSDLLKGEPCCSVPAQLFCDFATSAVGGVHLTSTLKMESKLSECTSCHFLED